MDNVSSILSPPDLNDPFSFNEEKEISEEELNKFREKTLKNITIWVNGETLESFVGKQILKDKDLKDLYDLFWKNRKVVLEKGDLVVPKFEDIFDETEESIFNCIKEKSLIELMTKYPSNIKACLKRLIKRKKTDQIKAFYQFYLLYKYSVDHISFAKWISSHIGFDEEINPHSCVKMQLSRLKKLLEEEEEIYPKAKKVMRFFQEDGIELLTHVVNLNLSTQELFFLPEAICEMKRLKKLDLSFNHLRYFPEGMRGLRDLQVISLTKNKISFLPDFFRYLDQIKEMYLVRNPWKKLPEFLGMMPNLLEMCIDPHLIQKVDRICPLIIFNLHFMIEGPYHSISVYENGSLLPSKAHKVKKSFFNGKNILFSNRYEDSFFLAKAMLALDAKLLKDKDVENALKVNFFDSLFFRAHDIHFQVVSFFDELSTSDDLPSKRVNHKIEELLKKDIPVALKIKTMAIIPRGTLHIWVVLDSMDADFAFLRETLNGRVIRINKKTLLDRVDPKETIHYLENFPSQKKANDTTSTVSIGDLSSTASSVEELPLEDSFSSEEVA